MQADAQALLDRRRNGFDQFYEELIPALVDFVERLEIRPAHEVLNHAAEYVPHVAEALRGMQVQSDEDRIWLLARVAYFVGEYFAQQHHGHWFVCDTPESAYFARYVVGGFAPSLAQGCIVDPFEIAKTYVDTHPPRDLAQLIADVEAAAGRPE